MGNRKLALCFLVTVLFIWGSHELMAQDAAEVYLMSKQADGYYESDDARQDSVVFFLCREIDALRDDMSDLGDDIAELRAWIWKLALLVGGGGAVAGGGGVAAARIRKNGGVKC